MKPRAKNFSCASRSLSDGIIRGVRMTSSLAMSRAVIAEQAPLLMQVTGLTKTYGDQRALADISFSVRSGEILGLIGPNGAGKTTLLEAIAGILPADKGKILWRGMSLPASKRRDFIFY